MSLGAGETGCLKGGDVFPANEIQTNVLLTRYAEGLGGRPGSPITLRTEPDAPSATLLGTVELRVSDVTITHVELNGKSPILPGQPELTGSAIIIRGDRITLFRNDIHTRDPITNQGSRICVDVGYRMMEDFGKLATDVVIDGNRIHHCGNATPDGGSGEHGLYLQQSLRARVTNNYIYSNQDRGIQVYFESDYAIIANNVVDANGSNLHIGGLLFEQTGFNNNRLSNRYSDHTQIVRNIFSNATTYARAGKGDRYNIETFWAATPAGDSGPAPERTENFMAQNCIYQAPSRVGPVDRTFASGWSGVTRIDNFISNSSPRFVNSVVGDFRLQLGSPCTGKGPFSGEEPLPDAHFSQSR